MKVGISLLGLKSHWLHVVGLAREIRAAGHQVVVFAPPQLAFSVMSCGFEYVEVSPDWTAAPGVGEALGEILVSKGNDEFCRTLVTDYVVAPPILQKVDELALLCKALKIDILVRDSADFAAHLAALLARLPCVNTDNGVAGLLYEHRGLINPRLMEYRSVLNLEDEVGTPWTERLFSPTPPGLLLPEMPCRVTHYRHEPAAMPGDALPYWIRQRDTSRPLIYVSLGTILTCAPAMVDLTLAMYRQVVAALIEMRCDAIVAVGERNVTKIEVPESAEHVRVIPWAPQPLLFAAGVIDAAVLHGGRASVAEALRAGVPTVTLAISTDQPKNADRLTELNLTVALARTAVAADVENALTVALEDQRRMRRPLADWRLRFWGLPTGADAWQHSPLPVYDEVTAEEVEDTAAAAAAEPEAGAE